VLYKALTLACGGRNMIERLVFCPPPHIRLPDREGGRWGKESWWGGGAECARTLWLRKDDIKVNRMTFLFSFCL